MKTLFLEAKYNEKIKLDRKIIQKIKAFTNEVALFTTVQFIGSLEGIKRQLEDNKIKVKLFKPKHCRYKGQLLGCSIEKFNAEAFLYIGDGMFHPIALKISNNKTVFVFNLQEVFDLGW